MSRALERFARDAALEVERLADERRRWREGSSELARLAELDRLTGAHVAAHIAESDRIHADEEALRRKYFPKSARLMVSDWDGSVITVSPTGRLRTVYVPGPKPTCADKHRDWEHQVLPWVCSLEPGHDGDHVAMVDDNVEVCRWAARDEVVPDAPTVEAPMPHDDEHDAAEPPYGDRVLAIGLWSDAEAFTLAETANTAASEGRDPGQAVQDLARSWDAGEVTE